VSRNCRRDAGIAESNAHCRRTRHSDRCRHNPLGVKGAGEAGAIGSCPAVMNAIIDALWRAFRIAHLDMPATPERVWKAIDEIRRVRAL